MSKEQLDDLIERAARTFVQAAVPAIPVVTLTDWSTIRAGLAAGAVAGGAAVLSAAASWLRSRRA